MLDSPTYRASEQLAKSLLPHWRFGQVHNLDVFERIGFPVRIASIRELGPLLDSMQENRFDAYMRELDGLSDDEYNLLLEACKDSLRFQLRMFPQRPPVAPLSTMMSVITLYKKMLGFKPDFRTVLEIGPGCGYLSFLLKHHRSLENYSQIEACESYYILQNLVNVHCFDTRVDERVFIPPTIRVSDFLIANEVQSSELPNPVNLRREPPLCTHYPWWRIGELISDERRFEIVTSNANLLEFSPAALEDYLTLVSNVLEPGGIFLIQCMGYHEHGNLETLLEKVWSRKFVPLLYAVENRPMRFPGAASAATVSERIAGKAAHDVVFPVNNGLLIRPGHPLYERYRQGESRGLHFIANEPVVDAMYFRRPPHRRHYTMDDVISAIESSLVL